jgi:hypothetical protein
MKIVVGNMPHNYKHEVKRGMFLIYIARSILGEYFVLGSLSKITATSRGDTKCNSYNC